MLNKMLMINKSSGRSKSRLFVEKYFLPLFFIAMIFAIISSGCNKDYIEPIEKVLPPCDSCGTTTLCDTTIAIIACNTIPNDTVSFSLDIQPIFTANCASCHSGGSPSAGLNLSASVVYNQLLTNGPNAPYVNTANPETSLLYEKINTGTMAQYVTPAERSKILDWINEGAKNN